MPPLTNTSISAGTSPAKGYLPTLDGWRAIAVLLVLFHHADVLRFGSFSTQWLYNHGDFGVQIFFAISGILICSRLLEEEARTGSLHLRGFYIRRVLRIQPAALLFLLVILLLRLSGTVPLSWQGFLSGLLLVRNYLPWNAIGSTDWATLHFWSLSVEEHFYLALPAFLLFVKERRMRILLGVIVALIAWSAINARFGLIGPQAYHRTDLCLPALLVPATAAIALRRERFQKLLAKYLHPLVGLALTACVMVPIWQLWHHRLSSAASLAPTLLVLSTMLHPETLLGRLLEWSPLRFLGRISFGLYLWQEIFFVGHEAPLLRPFGVFSYAPCNFVIVLALATASYFILEKPCMRLGHRLARPALPGRPELDAPRNRSPRQVGADAVTS